MPHNDETEELLQVLDHQLRYAGKRLARSSATVLFQHQVAGLQATRHRVATWDALVEALENAETSFRAVAAYSMQPLMASDARERLVEIQAALAAAKTEGGR